jgi:hypothetical protein
MSDLTTARTAADLEDELHQLAAELRRLGEGEATPGSLLALETRRLAGGAADRVESRWDRYARGGNAQLPVASLLALQRRLARIAADPGPELAEGWLSRHLWRDVFAQAGIAPRKAAGLLLDDLRDSLSAESAKRLSAAVPASWPAAPPQLVSSALTHYDLDPVLTAKEGEVTRLAKTAFLPQDGLLLKKTRQLLRDEASLAKLDGPAARRGPASARPLGAGDRRLPAALSRHRGRDPLHPVRRTWTTSPSKYARRAGASPSRATSPDGAAHPGPRLPGDRQRQGRQAGEARDGFPPSSPPCAAPGERRRSRWLSLRSRWFGWFRWLQ